MRKFSRVLLLIVALMLALISFQAASAQDEEKEPPQVVIPILEDGESIEDFFEGDVTAKLYAFNATEGDSVTITVNAIEADVAVDPYMIVLGSAGQMIALDDDSGDGLNALIEDLEIPASGGYLIVITSLLNRSTSTEVEEAQPFELTITGNAQPTDLEGFDPQSVTFYNSELEYGVPFEGGYSNLAEPVYYFVFNGDSGDVINITTESEDLDTLLYLFNPLGERIAVNDDLNGTSAGVEALELVEAGRYLIFATRFGFWGAIDADEESFPEGLFTITIDTVE